MKILAIDTALGAASACLFESASNQVLARETVWLERGHDQTIVVVCDEGYASSLAADTLRRLGLVNATDLDGGYQAWRRWSAG